MSAAAVAALTLVGNAPGAVASTGCFTLPSGYDVCTINRGHAGTDSIGVWNTSDTMVAHMRVICTGNGGNRWEADRDTRYVSYSDLQNVANWWCRNY